jgi:cytochrome c biogenesis protein CcmG, thiol:disulfide interchange protein DsbE
MDQKAPDRPLARPVLACGLLLIVTALFVYIRPLPLLRTEEGAATAADSMPFSRGSAVPFEAPDLEGKTIRTKDFEGKVVLLNFWGTTCAPCIQEIPWLVDFQKRYGPDGLQVIAVSMYGESPEVLKPYVAEHQMGELKVVIGNEQIAALFGLALFPTTFIADRNGKYLSIHRGLIDRAEVEAELVTLLNR